MSAQTMYVCPAFLPLMVDDGLCRRFVFGLGRENLPLSAKIAMYRYRLYVNGDVCSRMSMLARGCVTFPSV